MIALHCNSPSSHIIIHLARITLRKFCWTLETHCCFRPYSGACYSFIRRKRRCKFSPFIIKRADCPWTPFFFFLCNKNNNIKSFFLQLEYLLQFCWMSTLFFPPTIPTLTHHTGRKCLVPLWVKWDLLLLRCYSAAGIKRPLQGRVKLTHGSG